MGSARNVEIFEETLRICRDDEDLRKAISESLLGQEIVMSADTLPVIEHGDVGTTVELIPSRSIEATAGLEGRTCVLNFANYYRPGGGVRAGCSAQEEAICRITTLYPCISSEKMRESFYNPHWNDDQSASDDLIYTPGVVVIRVDSDEMELLPPSLRYDIDVITCAAPDLRGAPCDRAMMAGIFEKRFDRIMDVAAAHGVDNLVLGAFGCGVFGNDPRTVAGAANRSCERHMGLFRRIIFAVPFGNRNHTEFEAVFQTGSG